MKKLMLSLLLLTLTTSAVTFTGCREKKTTEKIEDTVEDVGDDVEDAVDDAGDAIEDATDDNSR